MEQEEVRFRQFSEQVQGNKEQILLMTNMLKQQGAKIDKIYESLIGNGSPKSIVARLLIAEKCQKDAAKDQHEMAVTMEKLSSCVTKLDKRSANDYRTIQDLKGGQDDLNEGQDNLSIKLDENTKTIAAWRNRAVGIGIGVGLGTSVIIYLLQQIFSNVTIP